MRPGKIILLLLLSGMALPACNRPKTAAELVSFSLLEHTNWDSLRIETEKISKQFSDSGTIGKLQFNNADTLKWALREPGFHKHWMELLLKEGFLGELAGICEKTRYHGMDTAWYHTGFISRFTDDLNRGKINDQHLPSHEKMAWLLLLTADATLAVYHDMGQGRISPAYTGSVDVLPRRNCGNLKGLLTADSTRRVMKTVFPAFKPYTLLQAEYQRLLNLKDTTDPGNLTVIKSIKPGDTLTVQGIKKIALKLRLAGYGNWPDSLLEKSDRYEPWLSEAVKRYRVANNVEASGKIDKEVAAMLNVPRLTRLLRLRATLERWRWMGPVPETTFIWANIAENRVYAWKNDTLKTDMNICSGQNRDANYYRKLKLSREKNSKILPPDNLETPLLKAKLTHLVVNPVWYVPHNIAIKEILPEIKKNPASLASYGYVLKDRNGDEVNPFAIDWSHYSARNFPFKIEQISGDENSLGSVVIHFPNAYSIYMHDTNVHWVFGLEERHISHGCLRLEKPFDMVAYISSFAEKDNIDNIRVAAGLEPLKDKKLIKEWKLSKTDSALREKFSREDNKYFKANVQMPVYIVYQTAFVSPMGAVKYSSDTYKRDAAMIRMMARPEKVRNPVKKAADKPN